MTRNAAGIPSVTTTSAASAGPAERAMLNVIEFSATAEVRSSSSTSCVTSACCAGTEKALVTPSASPNAITTWTGAAPANASAPSVRLSAAAPSCQPIRRRRRSSRSARAPAHGLSTSSGANWVKLSTPSRNGECVCR